MYFAFEGQWCFDYEFFEGCHLYFVDLLAHLVIDYRKNSISAYGDGTILFD